MKTRSMLVLAMGLSVLAQVNAQETAPREAQPNIQLGTPVHTVDPMVPDQLRDKPVAAVLNVTIKSDGSFEDLSALAGDPAFALSTLDAVRQWVYTPATLNGSPVEVRAFVMIGSNRGDIYNENRARHAISNLSSGAGRAKDFERPSFSGQAGRSHTT